MKPVALVERAIRNSSKSRDTVLDPFAGSGTTLMAAEATGRRAALIELDPRYCDVIVRRWQEFTGEVATLEGKGCSFAEVAAERGIGAGEPHTAAVGAHAAREPVRAAQAADSDEAPHGAAVGHTEALRAAGLAEAGA